MQKEVKVGKKGQVVIPKAMRTALKIEACSKVTFRLEDNKIIIKPFFDAVAVFQRVAQESKHNEKIDPHGAYDEEMEERHKRAGLLQ
ncbi:MAG: AbrB/MazE/SpoVT family DNA-binding domain-containing protein [Chloroflexi bacterium]|nr:AbrB/MazE/SpoVT family DNA-binding domain-containing protein [Chloroflexota bacterium]MCL5949312.1 AbrB/MazE/SpoVT family DNA-binding domain-containing protein [Candidatus Bathyarchaeota archaeon]